MIWKEDYYPCAHMFTVNGVKTRKKNLPVQVIMKYEYETQNNDVFIQKKKKTHHHKWPSSNRSKPFLLTFRSQFLAAHQTRPRVFDIKIKKKRKQQLAKTKRVSTRKCQPIRKTNNKK